MEDQVKSLESLIESAKVYGETSMELYKLKAIEKTAEISSSFIARAFAFCALVLFMLMISIGVAFWLGDIMGKVYYGFLCVGGFYGVFGFVLYFVLYDWIKDRVNNSIISQMLN